MDKTAIAMADPPARGQTEAALELSGVVKQFEGVRALAGVDVGVNPGEILGLIGPNGSGKTTLLNVASGVLRPSEGEVRVAGGLTRGRPHRFSKCGVARTFQHVRLFGEMTVGENVEVGAISAGVALESADAALKELGLIADKARLAQTLAYGQQRRVEIARALAGQPSVLLLDEPVAGMNAAESDQLLIVLRKVRDELKCALIIVEHDLRFIMRLCDRVVVLSEGRVISEGTPEHVQRDPTVVEAYLGTVGDRAGNGS